MSLAGAIGRDASPGADAERASRRLLVGVAALVLAASVVATILWCRSMSAMVGMPMPGGWTMSMTWMRMPRQTWPGAAASFVGMWTVMMVAMMSPSWMAALWRRRVVAGMGRAHRGWGPAWMIAVAAAGYFCAWAMAGAAVYPVGVALASLAMRQPELARAVPIAVGGTILIAGALQFSAWKAHHLVRCRDLAGRCVVPLPADAGGAWRCGLRLGLHCIGCSAGPTAILLVLGIMDLRVMAAVTAAVTVERLSPAGESAAHAVGWVLLGTGLILMMRAAG